MPPDSVSIKLTIHFDKKLKAWVLVPGGWFPLQLAAVDVLLVDRNITSALKTLETSPNRPDLTADKWWLEHLNKPSPVINPVLCAMEGRWRSPPTFEQFETELDVSYAILKRTLPQASVLRHPKEHLHAVYEVCISQAPRMQREIDFLVAVCPVLSSRSPTGKEARLETFIFQEADRLGVSRQSLCCLAALSVLYELRDGNQPRIGRGVLKPKPQYNESFAYSALSDLRALEFLAAGSSLPGPSLGLCTRDKHLAAFWTYLGVHSGTWDGKSFSASYTPKSDLFPRLNEDAFIALFRHIKDEA